MNLSYVVIFTVNFMYIDITMPVQLHIPKQCFMIFVENEHLDHVMLLHEVHISEMKCYV